MGFKTSIFESVLIYHENAHIIVKIIKLHTYFAEFSKHNFFFQSFISFASHSHVLTNGVRKSCWERIYSNYFQVFSTESFTNTTYN